MTILKRYPLVLAATLLVACGSAAPVPVAAHHPVVDQAPAAQAEATAQAATEAQPSPTDLRYRVAVPAPPAPSRPAGPLPARPVAMPSPSSAPTPKASPTPWIPPLLICPKPVPPDWITLTMPAICEPEHVFAFVAPPGWKPGDPVPPFKPAP